jgi:NAD(P)H-dependent FMN reductase
MSADRPLIAIVVGSGRRERFADYPLEWLREQLADRDDLELSVIDLRDYALPFYDEDVPPAKAPREYHGNAELQRLARAVDAAEGFIVISPEYNHGYPALLKNALDHLFVEFNRKPVAFVGYGNVGGARSIEQLRLVTIELEMAPSRFSVNIFPHSMSRARAGEHPGQVFAEYTAKLQLAVDDLVWWSRALTTARTRAGDGDAS